MKKAHSIQSELGDISPRSTYCDSAELEELLLKERPATCGLHSHEIQMLVDVANERYDSCSSFSNCRYSMPSVRFPGGLFKSLLDRGFVRLCDQEELIDHLRLAEMRQIFEGTGIKASNTTERTRQRARENFTPEFVERRVGYRRYLLTESGWDAVLENATVNLQTGHKWYELEYHPDSSQPFPDREALEKSAAQYDTVSGFRLLADSSHADLQHCQLVMEPQGIEVELFRENSYAPSRTIDFVVDQQTVFRKEAVTGLLFPYDSRYLIFSKKDSDGKYLFGAYNFELGRFEFQAQSLSAIEVISASNEESSANRKLLDVFTGARKGMFDDCFCHYYFTPRDGIDELIASELVSEKAELQEVDLGPLASGPSIYKLSAHREDLNLNENIMFMLRSGHFRLPRVLGIPLQEIASYVKPRDDGEEIRLLCGLSNKLDEAMGQNRELARMTEAVDEKFGSLLAFLATKFPPRMFSDNPYWRYRWPGITDEAIREFDMTKSKFGDWYRAQLLELKRRGLVPARWKNEFLLYRLLCDYYPTVIFQYRADWLGLQSLDVFVPSLKLGIEYQGIQHYEPVDFFGGEGAFRQRQKLDDKKRRLCKENGIKLCEWPYTDAIDEGVLEKKLAEFGIKMPRKLANGKSGERGDAVSGLEVVPLDHKKNDCPFVLASDYTKDPLLILERGDLFGIMWNTIVAEVTDSSPALGALLVQSGKPVYNNGTVSLTVQCRNCDRRSQLIALLEKTLRKLTGLGLRVNCKVA